MKERPILFSGPMVLPTLDGRKTQTRRTVTITPKAAAFLAAVDILAAEVPNGDLIASTGSYDLLVAASEEIKKQRDLVRRLVGAMREWGSWGDGVPDPECYGKDNVALGCAFDEAVAFLKERKP